MDAVERWVILSESNLCFSKKTCTFVQFHIFATDLYNFIYLYLTWLKTPSPSLFYCFLRKSFHLSKIKTNFSLLHTAWKVSKYGVISGPYFSVVNLRIQSEYRKLRTRNNSVFGHFSRSAYHFHSTGALEKLLK